MRKLTPLVLALALLASGLGPASASAQPSPPPTKIAPTLAARIAANPLAFQPIILEMQPAATPLGSAANIARAQAALSLLSIYGQPVGGLAIVNGAAGWATGAAIQTMSALPGVAFVHDDATVAPRKTSTPGTAWPPGRLASLYPKEVQADRVRPQSTGTGVTVAVLDSGVAADIDLVQPSNRLLAAVNFADHLPPGVQDPGGHGTHVAGVIAGNGRRSAGQYVGIAPGANIVDVRVLDAQGNGRISSVVRGIEWVLAHRDAYHIRILNLSFGAPPPPTYQVDPLSAAIEIAWKHGMVVVAAAGNTGPTSGTVHSPGVDPYAITVGAADDVGTLALADDGLAWFSSWGSAKPDLIAPGRKLVSIRVPGSTLDTMMADHITPASNGASYFRLTGTSQATGVVSGAAALVLARQPGLSPDEVKAILVGTTQTYGPAGGPALPHPSADGAGLLNARAAYLSPSLGRANAGQRPSSVAARALQGLLRGDPLVWRDPGYQGILWNILTWATLSWDDIAWDNLSWDDIAWDDIAWDDIAWDDIAWDDIAWDRAGWDDIAWDSARLD